MSFNLTSSTSARNAKHFRVPVLLSGVFDVTIQLFSNGFQREYFHGFNYVDLFLKCNILSFSCILFGQLVELGEHVQDATKRENVSAH